MCSVEWLVGGGDIAFKFLFALAVLGFGFELAAGVGVFWSCLIHCGGIMLRLQVSLRCRFGFEAAPASVSHQDMKDQALY